MIYFTSDLHFGHDNIIEYCDRPFDNVVDMDLSLIKNWNKIIRDKDDVYILGDVSFYKDIEHNRFLLDSLRGKKHLILGNHDYRNVIPRDCFVEIVDYKELKYNKKFFVLSHYPILSWNKKHRGSIHLYGHTHSRSLGDYENQNCMNVGVDKNDFKPISIEEIIHKFNNNKM